MNNTAAYRADVRYRFALTLAQGDKEKYVEIETDSPLFTNVCAERRRLYPGWTIKESLGEIPQAPPSDDLPSYEQLFARADAIAERYAA